MRGKAGDPDGAIEDFGEAIRLAPRSAEALAERCAAFYQAKDYARATKDCDAALAVDAANTDAWHRRVEILFAQDKRPEALKAARRLTKLAPQWAHARVLVARIQMASGDLASAERELEDARKAAPDDGEVATARIGLLRRRGDEKGAREVADGLVSAAPRDSRAYLLRARVHQAVGDDDRALADMERAIELDPTNASTHNSRAWLLLKLGRSAEGLEAVERSLELRPGEPHATGTRCWLRASLGDEAGARLDCAHASRLLPESLLDRGMLHFLEGRPAEAAAAWREAGTQEPEDVRLLAPWLAKTEAARRRTGPSGRGR
jgi:tetratricopeptide (TPR) repeat protein